MDANNQTEQNNTIETANAVAPAQETAAPTETAAPQTPKPSTKKTGILVALIILAVVAALIVGGFFLIYESFGGNSQPKAKNYLEDKYGKDEGFSEGSYSGGSSFEVGYDEYLFTSNKSDIDFHVHYNNKNKTFSDNYYAVQFEKDFQNYYYNKYGKKLKGIIPYNFTLIPGDLQFGYNDFSYPYVAQDKKFNSFDEALEFVNGEKDDSGAVRTTISLGVDYKEIGIDQLEMVDFSEIKYKAKDIISDIHSIEKDYSRDSMVEVYLDVIMKGSGRTGLCPENLHAATIRPDSMNSDDPNEEIWFCQVELARLK